MGDPMEASESTSAMAIRTRNPPFTRSATSIWSKSREESLSIEDHSSARMSHITIRGRRRSGLERRQLFVDPRGEIGIEALVDHLLTGDGKQIKSNVGHETIAYHLGGRETPAQKPAAG